MISRVKRYFLEIKDFSNPIDLNIPKDYQILLLDDVVTSGQSFNVCQKLIAEANYLLLSGV